MSIVDEDGIAFREGTDRSPAYPSSLVVGTPALEVVSARSVKP